MNNKLIIMVGLPGAGKNTYIRNYLSDYKVISSDDIRVELYGFEDQTKNKEVYILMRERTREALKSGQSVVYNATNLSAKRRKSLAEEMKKYCDKIELIYIDCSLPELLNRNEFREERYIDEDKLILMYNSFKPGFYEYPYDLITYYKGELDDKDF